MVNIFFYFYVNWNYYLKKRNKILNNGLLKILLLLKSEKKQINTFLKTNKSCKFYKWPNRPIKMQNKKNI